MKKIFIFAVLITSLGIFASAAPMPDVEIIVEGEVCVYEQVPINVNGSTLLPLRALAETLGIPNDDEHIIWNEKTKSVTVKNADLSRVIEITVGSQQGKINGESTTLYTAPVLYKNSTYIPLRFVAEAFDMKVLWDAVDRSVYIRDIDEYEDIALMLRVVEYPLIDGVADYKKTMSEVCYTVKRNVPLEKYQSIGDYHIDLSGDALVLDVQIEETYNKRSATINYKSDGDRIIYSDSTGRKYYMESEEETDFIIDLLSDVGLHYEVYDPEEEESEEEEIAQDTGALSIEEKICMCATVSEADGSISLVIPYQKISPSEDCNYYNRTLTFDSETWYLQSEKYELQLTGKVEGVDVLTDRVMLIEFK